MGALHGFRPAHRPSEVSRLGTVTGCGLSLVAALFLLADPRVAPADYPPALILLAITLACYAALFRNDAWPFRLALLTFLILLASSLTGPQERRIEDPSFFAYSLLLASAATLTLCARPTRASWLFTAALGLLSISNAVATALVRGVVPAAAAIVAAVWIIMLAVRLAAPPALAAYWADIAVYQESAAAHLVAQQRRSHAAREVRELHDTVLRALTVIGRQGAGAGLPELKAMLDAGNTPDAGAAAGTPVRDAVVHSAGSVPSFGSVPSAGPAPSPSDLEQAFRRLAARHGNDSFAVDVSGTAAGLPGPLRNALLAAAEECLINVERHAGTRQADILLSETADTVCVVVSDSGKGFDPEQVPADRLGISGSVLARMRDAGGSARIFSSPGSGTTVLLEAPKPAGGNTP